MVERCFNYYPETKGVTDERTPIYPDSRRAGVYKRCLINIKLKFVCIIYTILLGSDISFNSHFDFFTYCLNFLGLYLFFYSYSVVNLLLKQYSMLAFNMQFASISVFVFIKVIQIMSLKNKVLMDSLLWFYSTSAQTGYIAAL